MQKQIKKRRNKCSRCGVLGHNKKKCRAPSAHETGQSAPRSRPTNAHILNEFLPGNLFFFHYTSHNNYLNSLLISSATISEQSGRDSLRRSMSGVRRPATADNMEPESSRSHRLRRSVSGITRPPPRDSTVPESSRRQSGRQSVSGVPRPTDLPTHDNQQQQPSQGTYYNLYTVFTYINIYNIITFYLFL